MNIVRQRRRGYPQRLLLTLAFGSIGFCALAFDLDPVLLGHWPLLPRGLGYAVASQNGYAFVADGPAGLTVIDVSNPGNPQTVGGDDTRGIAYGVAVSGDYAYVADYDSGLEVIDVSNPAHPQQVGNFTTPPSIVFGVAVSGNYAYLADYSAGLRVVDVSNPAHPQSVGISPSGRRPYGVAVLGHYAYVADLDLGREVIDVINPASPQRTGGYGGVPNAS